MQISPAARSREFIGGEQRRGQMYAGARLTTLPTLALPPVCSIIAPDRLQNAITTRRAPSKRAA
jgi:hypothetical protein